MKIGIDIQDYERKMDIAKKRIAIRISNSMAKKLVSAPINPKTGRKIGPPWGVDTGQLKASVSNGFKITEDGIEFSMLDYGKYIEFGGKNQKPYPFIRMTFHQEAGKIIREELERAFSY